MGNKLELERENLNAFPNPTTDFITIKTESPIFDIEIINYCGTLVYKQNIFGATTKLNISMKELTVGFYIVKVKTSSGSSVRAISKQ